MRSIGSDNYLKMVTTAMAMALVEWKVLVFATKADVEVNACLQLLGDLVNDG